MTRGSPRKYANLGQTSMRFNTLGGRPEVPCSRVAACGHIRPALHRLRTDVGTCSPPQGVHHLGIPEPSRATRLGPPTWRGFDPFAGQPCFR